MILLRHTHKNDNTHKHTHSTDDLVRHHVLMVIMADTHKGGYG